ncbi:MAG: DUF3089 domain-containing protein [Muribaculaceae bacterium]|nr:DUF3089 domain-containing protein [Muribaculaceae bacterium]
MRRKVLISTAVVAILAVIGIMAWHNLSADTKADPMPAAPDYADSSMWYVSRHDSTGTAADIFYVCSTETADWTDSVSGKTMHFADVTRTDHRTALFGEMLGVDTLFAAAGCDFYAPYYRQATMEGLLADTTQFLPRSLKATDDVKRAWHHFCEHRRQDRPFILMGYSQGAFAVVELLKSMPPEEYRNMVAAYVIGYKITRSDLSHPAIKPATGATDAGVTVCFNSVASPQSEIPIISAGTAVGINPVNWRTDATPAPFTAALITTNTLTATLDTARHLVIVSGYDGPCPQIPFAGIPGNYHCLEIPFYATTLAQNITTRLHTHHTTP